MTTTDPHERDALLDMVRNANARAETAEARVRELEAQLRQLQSAPRVRGARPE